MNWFFAAAAVLAFLVGLVHSVLGERLIFRHLRARGFIPTRGDPVLREHQVRILWVSWHLVTVFGWCLAAGLAWLAQPLPSQAAPPFLVHAITVSMFAGSLLVFVGTKGRHLGWAGLLGVAVLMGLGQLPQLF